jgi:hypothetical protein
MGTTTDTTSSLATGAWDPKAYSCTIDGSNVVTPNECVDNWFKHTVTEFKCYSCVATTWYLGGNAINDPNSTDCEG